MFSTSSDHSTLSHCCRQYASSTSSAPSALNSTPPVQLYKYAFALYLPFQSSTFPRSCTVLFRSLRFLLSGSQLVFVCKYGIAICYLYSTLVQPSSVRSVWQSPSPFLVAPKLSCTYRKIVKVLPFMFRSSAFCLAKAILANYIYFYLSFPTIQTKS